MSAITFVIHSRNPNFMHRFGRKLRRVEGALAGSGREDVRFVRVPYRRETLSLIDDILADERRNTTVVVRGTSLSLPAHVTVRERCERKSARQVALGFVSGIRRSGEVAKIREAGKRRRCEAASRAQLRLDQNVRIQRLARLGIGFEVGAQSLSAIDALLDIVEGK